MGHLTHDTAFSGHLTAVLERQAGVSPGGLANALIGLLSAADSSLPVAPAEHRDVWDGDTGIADRLATRDIRTRALDDLTTAWGVPLASSAARVHRDGNRDEWESVAFARQRKLSRAAVTAAVTLEEKWIDEVADGVTLLCEQSSWCWPAHDDAMKARGSILATVTDPFLDLGAGEVVAQLAWIDHLLGSQLDARYPGLRARIRHETRVRVLEPFTQRRDWHWLGLDGDVHNWNPWIHGNVLVAALRLMDAPEQQDQRAAVVALVIEGLDRYVTSLPEDGAIDEGYAYWWNGACRALEALDLLSYATGGVLDPTSEITALRETVAFPHRMHLGGDWYLNLADGQARPPRDQAWHSLHRAAVTVGDAQAQAHAASYRNVTLPAATEAEGLGRLLRGVTDAEWLNATAAAPPLPRDVWLESTEVMIARAEAGSPSGLTVAGKGGHNAEHHNHNDVGSIIVASDGVPVIVDAGRPTYTLATFSDDRYSIWTMQSSWHNVPEIRGVAQPAGAAAHSSNVEVAITDTSSALALELATAYPVPGLRSWRRKIRLDRDRNRDGGRAIGSGRETVTIEDQWSLDPWQPDPLDPTADEPPTFVRFLLAGDVVLSENDAVITPLNGAPSVRLRWPAGVAATLTRQPLTDPMLSDVWGAKLVRLNLNVADRDSLSVTVEMNQPKVWDPR